MAICHKHWQGLSLSATGKTPHPSLQPWTRGLGRRPRWRAWRLPAISVCSPCEHIRPAPLCPPPKSTSCNPRLTFPTSSSCFFFFLSACRGSGARSFMLWTLPATITRSRPCSPSPTAHGVCALCVCVWCCCCLPLAHQPVHVLRSPLLTHAHVRPRVPGMVQLDFSSEDIKPLLASTSNTDVLVWDLDKVRQWFGAGLAVSCFVLCC